MAQQAVFSTLLNPFGTTQMKKNFILIALFLKRYIIKHIGNAIKTQFFGENYQGLRIEDCDPGKQNHLQSEPTPQCQEIAYFSERRSSNFRKARSTKGSTQGHVEE